ncbi:hypothetical protein C9439_03315 [archaeon SCG-AAA382B04]|nr:hypothetical protein C9439_03315 [archaeon SCG-AAA382B04]
MIGPNGDVKTGLSGGRKRPLVARDHIVTPGGFSTPDSWNRGFYRFELNVNDKISNTTDKECLIFRYTG